MPFFRETQFSQDRFFASQSLTQVSNKDFLGSRSLCSRNCAGVEAWYVAALGHGCIAVRGRQRFGVGSGVEDDICVGSVLSATNLLAPWDGAWDEGGEAQVCVQVRGV